MPTKLRYVGLDDVHKESIVVAVAEWNRRPAAVVSQLANDWPTLLGTLRRLGSTESLCRCYEAGPTGFDLTRMGTMMGSAEYLPPEQATDARSADARSDIYALGCTLHFLLTGQPPYTGKNLTAKLVAHQKAPIPSLRAARSDVPEWLDKLFQQMLAKNPAGRPQFMGDVGDRLESPPKATWWQNILSALGWK